MHHSTLSLANRSQKDENIQRKCAELKEFDDCQAFSIRL